MTKKQFLKRCETAYDMGFFKDRDVSSLLRQGIDCFLRLRSVYARSPHFFEAIRNDHQGGIAIEEIEYGLDSKKTLAGDKEVYNAEIVCCILDHPCQSCAESKEAWHTRYGFCSHNLITK